MATLSTLKKRIEAAEVRADPQPPRPVHIICKTTHTQAEIDAIRAECDEYERRWPAAPEPLTIELTSYLDD